MTWITPSMQQLLQELADVYGFSFDILTADLDERSIGDRAASPEQLVTLLAKAKADALMPRLMDRPAHERPQILSSLATKWWCTKAENSGKAAEC